MDAAQQAKMCAMWEPSGDSVICYECQVIVFDKDLTQTTICNCGMDFTGVVAYNLTQKVKYQKLYTPCAGFEEAVFKGILSKDADLAADIDTFMTWIEEFYHELHADNKPKLQPHVEKLVQVSGDFRKWYDAYEALTPSEKRRRKNKGYAL